MNNICFKKTGLFFVLLLFVFSLSFAQKKQDGDTVERYIKKRVQELHIPGMAIAVLQKGKLIKEGYYGFSNLEYNLPVSSKTVFEIASMSKQFTCAGILLLQQEKKLSVNDKLSKYLDTLPVSWKNITLYQLMSHTSGLRDDWEESNDYFLSNNTNKKMFAAQKNYPLRYVPGEGFTYGNGPFELGLVIEKVSGKSYAQFMKERIFDPLGMGSTSIYDNRKIIPYRAAGYVWDDSVQTNGNDISPAAEARGDVGVIITLRDLIKWDLALRDDRLLNAESREAMFTPAVLNDGTYVSYGFGWFIYPMFGVINYDHSGGFRTGFNSDILRIAGKDLDIIILCNQWHAQASFTSFTIAALVDPSIYLNAAKKPVPDPDTARTHQLIKIMQRLANKEWNYEQFYRHYNFCGADPNDLEGILKDFKGLEYIDSLDLRAHPINLYGKKLTKAVSYKLIGGGPFCFAFYYTSEGKLAAINFEP